MPTPHRRTVAALAGLALALLATVAAPAVAQAPQAIDPTSPVLPAAAPEGRPSEGEVIQVMPPVPVRFDGKVLYFVRGAVGDLTPELRASGIEGRLQEIADAREAPGAVHVVEGPYSDLFVGDHFLASITDAESGGRAQRALYAQAIARIVGKALDEYRAARTPDAILRAGIQVAVATVVLLVLLVLIRVGRRHIGPALSKRALALLAKTRVQGVELIPHEAQERLVRRVAWTVHALVLLVLVVAWAEVVLHLLPWTRSSADRWLGFVFSAARDVLLGIVGFLPNLVYIALFGLVGYGANQLNQLFFRAVRAGAIRIPSFHVEWSGVTARIVSLFIFALVAVAVYPYLPGAGSSAFQAIGIFLGAVISLGSGSSVSNAIAGVVITYMRPFALGDFVKVGDATGTVIEQSSLSVRVLTIRNEQVTLPAAIVLSNPIVNYSERARDGGIAIRTGVSIGYDTPWRKVHELLLAAAEKTPSVLDRPAPWVIQSELHDFYVKYDLHAYVDDPARQHFILSDLNQSVQDAFFEAGVEILSPHYASLRDGNATAIPPGVGPAHPERDFTVRVKGSGGGSPGAGSKG